MHLLCQNRGIVSSFVVLKSNKGRTMAKTYHQQITSAVTASLDRLSDTIEGILLWPTFPVPGSQRQ